MSIPQYPLSLPQTALVTGYDENYPNMLLRSPMDTGPSKVRRKATNKPFTMTVPLIMSTAQKQLFEDFVTNTLEGGALRFGFTHPTKNTQIECRIIPADDSNLYSMTSIEGYWNITLNLEVMP